ncbi:MAG: hypothetical protein K6G07_08865, partial [Lachnospiraceae bacterium]|nr:hypothetical protein [Lachnospiraceae bacterium]
MMGKERRKGLTIMAMTDEDRAFLDRITGYANEVCADIDPQKTQVSVQLERLMPVLKEISEETGKDVEDIFIRYMDLASSAMVESEQKL